MNWSKKEKVSVFFFEAFDESWKDQSNPNGSENHFGLFTINGHAKYVLWSQYRLDSIKVNSRNNTPLLKTFHGIKDTLLKTVEDGKLFKYEI